MRNPSSILLINKVEIGIILNVIKTKKNYQVDYVPETDMILYYKRGGC